MLNNNNENNISVTVLNTFQKLFHLFLQSFVE